MEKNTANIFESQKVAATAANTVGSSDFANQAPVVGSQAPIEDDAEDLRKLLPKLFTAPAPMGGNAHPLMQLVTATGFDRTVRNGDMRTLVESYAAHGLPVHPCGQDRRDRVTGKPVDPQGKQPLTKWRTAATTDRDTLKQWWSQWPQACPALPLGEPEEYMGALTQTCPAVCWDIDRPDAAGGVDGLDTLKTWVRMHGPLPATLVVMTPGHVVDGTRRHGLHIYFALTPETASLKNRVGKELSGVLPGTDVRATGGYVMAPGSTRRDGGQYLPLLVADIAEMPRDLCAALPHRGDAGTPQVDMPTIGGAAPSARSDPLPASGVDLPGPLPDGCRLATDLDGRTCVLGPGGDTPYGVARLNELCADIRATPIDGHTRDGIGGAKGFKAVNYVAGGWLSEQTVRTQIDAALSSIFPGEPGEPGRIMRQETWTKGMLSVRGPNNIAAGVRAWCAATGAPVPAWATKQDGDKGRSLNIKSAVEEWGPVTRFTRPAPDPLPPTVFEKLPETLREYVMELAQHKKIAREYALFSCLCARAASLHGYVSVNYNIGAEPVGLFSVPVLRSGERKTTGIKPMLETFAAYEKMLRGRYQKIRRRAKKINELLDARQTALRRQMQEENAGAVEEECVHLEERKIPVPDTPRFFAQNVTPEKLMSLFVEQADRIAVLGTEDDFLSILDGRYSGIPQYGLVCRAYDREHSVLDRVRDGGVELSADPVLTMLCPVQPAVLRARKNKVAARDSGFDARTIYFVPPSGVGRRGGIPASQPVYTYEDAFLGMLKDGLKQDPVTQRLEDLEQHLDTPAVERGPYVPPLPEPVEMRLAPDALHSLLTTSEGLERSLLPGAENSDIPDFVSRSASRIARIAAIIASCAQGWKTRPIDADAVRTATEIEMWAIQQQRFVRTYLLHDLDDKAQAQARAEEDKDTAAHRLLGRLLAAARGRERIAWREGQQVWKKAFKGVDVTPLLNSLVERGYIQMIAPRMGCKERRPLIAVRPDAGRLSEVVDPDILCD